MTYSSKTPCPDRVLPSTTVWFFQRETKQSLHTPHSTLHTALFALQTSNFTLHTSHFTLLTSHCFLHTPNLTLHTSHCALRTPNLNAATVRRNLDAAITMRSAETELQNTIELRATASEIVAPKPDLDARAKKDDFEALFKRIFRRKIISAKMDKICWQITVAAFMQPLQYDLRDPAAKDNSITNAAAARSNLDAAITMRSAETELQNTIELRATASEIVAPKPDFDARAKKRRFWSTF